MEGFGKRVKLLIEVYGVNYAKASLTLAEKRRENRCEGHVTNQCVGVVHLVTETRKWEPT